MSVKPILFNTDMVRAILDGRKTVTRRVVKPSLSDTCPICAYTHNECVNEYIYDDLAQNIYCARCGCPVKPERNPPYQPGDILYVRETWFWNPCWDCGYDIGANRQCPEDAVRRYDSKKGEYGCYYYKASMEENVPSVYTYHHSIHMPKEAARIWLKVTDVRVERLQDITEEQAKAEGIGEEWAMSWWKPTFYDPDSGGYPRYRDVFAHDLWDSTIKKSDLDRYGWGANPWVWVIEFERCEKPEGEVK
jgi:hypothetical protein